MHAWLELPAFAMFASLAILYLATGTALCWVIFHSPMRARIKSRTGIVGLDTTVAILFALLTGFLASDVGERNQHAVRAVQTEASELRNLYTLSVASVSDMQAIRAALKRYVESAITTEWPAMAKLGNAPETRAAYDTLLREVSHPDLARDSGPVVHNAMMQAATRIGVARSERLALASDRTNTLKWVTVLILGVMTQIAIGVMHLERRGAQAAALVVFSLAAVVTLGLIALQEHPFDGAFRVTPAPLEDLLKL